MKPFLSAFLNRFQFRLMLFLLLVGSIPLLVAACIFYFQSSSYAADEQSVVVEQANKRLLERTKQELQMITQDLKQLADDYGVGRYVSRGEQPLDAAEEKRIRDYIDGLLRKQTAQSRYLLQVCIAFQKNGQTLCSQSGTAQVPFQYALEHTGKKLFPVPASDISPLALSGNANLMAVEPILDPRSRLDNGTVFALIALEPMLTDAQDKALKGTLLVLDQDKSYIYKSGTGGGAGDAGADGVKGYAQSSAKLELADLEWTSTLEIPVQANAFITKMRWVLIGLFLLLAIVSIGCSIAFANYVTKPVNRLRGLMKRAELGDLKAYWIEDGFGELDDLGQSYNQMLNRVEELIKQVKQEEALKKEAEMEALQYQLNPHFLYNTLNTIKWVAKIHKTPQISEVVSSLVRLLQASLGKKGDFITIREEAGLIRDYMEIQSFRYGEKIRLAFEIEDVAQDCLVPRMLLQPLVENAILHGIEPGKREGIITIRAYLDRDLLMCEVEDDGVGIVSKAAGEYEPSALALPVKRSSLSKERLSGVGISHIREKIKLYYGPDYKMLIINKPGEGTTIKMSLPIHQNEE